MQTATAPLRCGLLAIAVAAAGAATADATTPDGTSGIEEVTIVGERVASNQVTGAAHYIGEDALARQHHADIQRIIREVPGVSVQVEDGYGLRPNISIRGVATERSGRITLLEDNVLIAPAPYSAPSAYYFPTIGRMSAVEVLKGPAAITQGPYTIGGALNMVSTPIPGEAAGKLYLEGGEDATYRLHAHWGTTFANGFGVLLETHQWQSDGFQDIDRGGDSGLDVEDYTLKLGWASQDDRHAVELKLQYADQDSDQSYLGLTDADFADDAFRRYGVSALDNIQTEHEQVILRYAFQATDDLRLTATAYENTHQRNWFKTEGLDFDGSSSAADFSRTSWSSIVAGINSGAGAGGASATDLQAILDGTADTAAGAIQLRSNAREYVSEGIQFGADWAFTTGEVSHALKAGIRFHEDEEDRLQRNSTYSQVNGALVLDDLGLLGNAGNRLQEAEALSVFIHDRITFGDWVVTPGLRYEDIEQQRTRWETRDGRTTDPSSRAAGNVRDTRENDTTVWLPGIGVAYSLSDTTTLFGGVHKGFTAPSNAPGVDEEEAVNWELGVRSSIDGIHAEATWFLSDYDNILGACTASSGSDCTIGDAFNGDAATVWGLEVLLDGNLNPEGRLAVPMVLSYTYIDSEFDTDIADTDFFGDVSEGDPIPYIPEHQANLSLGVEAARWQTYLVANWVDQVCVRASCGAFERTDSSLTLDVSGHYALNGSTRLFAKVENLTGEEDIMGRQPYGARPNKDRTASVGVQIAF